MTRAIGTIKIGHEFKYAGRLGCSLSSMFEPHGGGGGEGEVIMVFYINRSYLFLYVAGLDIKHCPPALAR